MANFKQSYLFYDIETTGLNPCFDQVLQFAAIRTDLELRELERYEIQVKLNPDVIPAPAAIITHRIGITKSLTGVSEIDAMQQIHRLLNTTGTISMGYNTLGFDDEFLRFSFYRNLLSPYSHQFANGCSRMDLYPMTVMFYLYKPDVCQWPQINNQTSLKLELLSEVNQLAFGQAHTAMVDVEATLALARIFIQHRSMWDYLTGYFDKETDLSRMQQLGCGINIENKLFPEGLLIDGKFGINNNYLAPVLKLGMHAHYKNQTLWLRLDQEKLTETNATNIAENTFVIRKKIGERELILPMKERFLTKFDAAREKISQTNKAWLLANPQLLTSISEYHRHYTYPQIDNIDADAALYTIGFPSREEENLFQKFHQSNVEKKLLIIRQMTNPIRKQQAMRIMYRHYPAALSALENETYKEYLNANNFCDYRGQKKLSKHQAIAEISALQISKNLDSEQLLLIQELKDFCMN